MNNVTTTNPLAHLSPALRKKGIVIGLTFIGLLLFFGMWLSVATNSLFYELDQPANAWFMELTQRTPEWVETGMDMFTKLGSQGLTVVAVVILTVYAFRRQFRRFWLLFAAVVGGELLWLATIFLANRPRPSEVEALVGVTLPGFPSGHVMILITFFAALFYIYHPEIKERNLELPILILLVVLTIVSSFIRLYFNTHYLTDIMGGIGIGLAWAPIAFVLVDWIWLKRRADD